MSHVCPTALGRLKLRARAYLDEERGSATIWNVTWLLVFAGMAGLAIDSSNGYRHKTMLQSTADVAALAGAWHLPEGYLEEPYVPGGYTDVENEALAFAQKNMPGQRFGAYFSRNDILVGYWDATNRQFIPGDVFPAPDYAPVNAVRVDMASVNARGNGLPTSILHMAGIRAWDVRTTATAVYGIKRCLRNGIIAREGIDLASNTKILKNICLHGQLQANVNNNVVWANPGSLSTGVHPTGRWAVSPGQYDESSRAVDMSRPQRQNLYPTMVDRIPTIGRGMLAGSLHYRDFVNPKLGEGETPYVIQLPPKFEEIACTNACVPIVVAELPSGRRPIRLASLDGFASVAGLIGLAAVGDASKDGRTTTFYEVESSGGKYLWPLDDTTLDPDDGSKPDFDVHDPEAPIGTVASLQSGRIYFADDCKGGGEGTITLSGLVQDITLVTTCTIKIAKDARIENVVLLSTAGTKSDNDKSIEIANGAQIGANTACEGWGGVRMYANGTITTPSSGSSDAAFRQWYGAHLVARTSVQFAGLSDSSKGLSIMAGGEVKIASNAQIGGLDGTLDSTYPVGGCPPDGVKQEHGREDYTASLVD